MDTEAQDQKGKSTKRIVLTGAVALLGLASIGGVFANFTDTQSAGPTPITTGQVHIVLGTPAGDHGAMTVGPFTNMAEGDSIARVVELTNNTTIGASGTTGLSALTLQSTPGGTNAASDIVTDTTNGLHITVQSCATSPTETGGTTGPFTYACTGGFTTVVNNVPLATLDSAAQNILASAPVQGASVYFVVTATLPSTYADPYSLNGGACSTAGGANEQLQNCSLSVTYNFTATQRAGTVQ